MRYCLDTSALNRLLDDPEREAIVTGMLVGASFRISAYNVIEAAKTKNVSRRQELVRLMRRLAENKRPLDPPNYLIRAVARGYAQRSPKGEVSLTVNADPNLEGVWVALNEPERIDEEVRAELLAWAEKWENDYDGIAAGPRQEFQELFDKYPEQRPRTPAATIRSYMKHDQQIFEQFVAPIFEKETGKTLSRPEYDDLIAERMWALYFGGYAYACHQRAVQTDRFSRNRNAGGVDLGQAVYLRLCDRFVTNDKAQYRGLRFLNRFNRAAGHETEVLRYDTFRRRLLITV